jgi:hypothetical protein
MFKACKIKLFKGDEWMFVKLGGPLAPPVKTVSEMWQWFTKYNLFGQFFVRENSVTDSVEPGKFVLSTSKFPEAFWGLSVATQEMSFVSRGSWGGGGLKHGQEEIRFNPVLTLHQAKVTDRGIEPMDVSLTGKATVHSGGGMPMFSQRGSVINWEWRNWDWPAEQG